MRSGKIKHEEKRKSATESTEENQRLYSRRFRRLRQRRSVKKHKYISICIYTNILL